MAVVLKKADSIQTQPFDAGEGRLSLVDVVAKADGAPVSAGIAEVWAAGPIDFEYDDDCAVCYMLEGEVTLREGEQEHSFRPGDMVFIPQQEGLVVQWNSPSYGKFLYVTYPHWR